MDETQPQEGRAVNVPQPSPELEKLYLTHYTALRDSIFQGHVGLSFLEVDAILNRLSNRLHRYQGTAADFLPWAERYVRLWARHQGLYLSLVTDPENIKVIESAIWHELFTSTVDRAVEPQDIYGEFCLYLYSHVNGFISGPKWAKTTTRLYAMVKRHVSLYHNKKRFRRLNAVTERMKTGRGFNGAETLSDLELAEMRTIEQAESSVA